MVVERQTLSSPTNLNAGLAAMITEAFAIQKQLCRINFGMNQTGVDA
jgi:hypothetical protein